MFRCDVLWENLLTNNNNTDRKLRICAFFCVCCCCCFWCEIALQCLRAFYICRRQKNATRSGRHISLVFRGESKWKIPTGILMNNTANEEWMCTLILSLSLFSACTTTKEINSLTSRMHNGNTDKTCVNRIQLRCHLY